MNDGNFHLYPEHVYSIEYYLLEIDAIVKAARISDPQIRQDMEDRLGKLRDKIRDKTVRPKEVLRGLWEDFALKGPYHEVDTAVTISRHLSKDHLENNRELVNLIEAMRQ